MSHWVRVVLLVSLCICCALLTGSLASLAETLRPPGPDRSAGKFGGVYRRVLHNNPVTLDPAFSTDIYGGAVVRQIFDGLIQFDAQLRPLPAIANFWEASRDRRTWTFTLRRRVMFHHGREVTAHDFVYSFTRFLRVKGPTPVANFLGHIQGAKEFMLGQTPHIKGLKAVDRYTLQMVLEEPLAPSLALLGLVNAAVVPQEEVERLGERFGRAPVGTGPFKFVRWDSDQEIVLAANDSYYEGRPFLDAAVFKIVAGEKFEEVFAEFLQGNLEETIIPGGKVDKIRADRQYRQYQRLRIPMLSLIYIGFNTQFKPFDDRRVRQAFNYAVDKEAIVRDITRTGSLPATGAVPPGMLGYDPDLLNLPPHEKRYSYDPAKAQRLLAEAGYPDGTDFPVVRLWTASTADSTKAELVAYQRYLAELGLKVEIHFASDWPTYKQMLVQGQLPMFRLAWYADIPDPENMLSPLLHSASPTNHTFYRNPAVDQLLEQARKIFDEAQRITLYREVERLVMDDAPWIPQHYSVAHYLYQPYVQGLEVSLLGNRAIPLKKIWFKKDLIIDSIRATTHGQPSH
jgi:oligopeptide transport system substrate-binding protein